MRGFRSPMLGALVALACTPSMEVARREDDVHHLFLRSVAVYAPDLDVAATVELLLADARAAQMVGGSYEHEALGIADDFEAWASGGRRPILIRDEAVAGEWRARIAFTGPGSYRAETYRNASTPGERGEVIVREAATRADAWRGAVEEAKARANAEIRARLFSPYPDDAAEPMTFDLAIKAGRQWLADCDPDAAGIILHLGTGTETVTTDPRFIAARAAGEIEHRGGRNWFFARALVLREPGVIKSINLRIRVDADGVTVEDGAAEQGMREAHARADAVFVGNADAFMRRHGIRDDIVKQPVDLSPEARAKREAWFASVLGDSKASAPSGSAWSPEDAADMATRLGPAKMQALREYFAERPDAKVAVVGIDHGREVLSTIRDDAGRALAHVAMPAGDSLSERRYAQADSDHQHHPRVLYGVDLAETDFQRAQRMAMNTPADRAARSGPVDFKRAGEASRSARELAGKVSIASSTVLSACTCGGAGICSESCAEEIRSGRMQHPDGQCALGFEGRCRRCRRATHAAERAQRPARRAEQSIRKAGRTAAKKRRGWP